MLLELTEELRLGLFRIDQKFLAGAKNEFADVAISNTGSRADEPSDLQITLSHTNMMASRNGPRQTGPTRFKLVFQPDGIVSDRYLIALDLVEVVVKITVLGVLAWNSDGRFLSPRQGRTPDRFRLIPTRARKRARPDRTVIRLRLARLCHGRTDQPVVEKLVRNPRRIESIVGIAEEVAKLRIVEGHQVEALSRRR